MKLVLVLVISTVYMWTNIILADADIDYGGTGCPAGTAQISIGENGETIFHLSAYEISRESLERLTCNFAITYQVPAGYSANFGNVKIFGIYDLDKETTATLSSQPFFAGSTGPSVNDNFNANTFGIINKNFRPNLAWSACGASLILRLNTSILQKTLRGNFGHSQIKIEEVSVGKPILRRCSDFLSPIF